MPLADLLDTNHRQAVNDLGQKCPPGSYKALQRPLKDPPKGTAWHCDPNTHEWSLRPQTELEPTTTTTITTDEDFIEHVVKPDDTFQGICLRYRITATQLRQSNGCLSGASDLRLAPSTLRIPTRNGVVTTSIKLATNSKEEKIRAFRRAQKSLSVTEAKCYLELNDWNVEESIANAIEDAEFEQQQQRE